MEIPDNHEWVHVVLPYLTLEPAHVERMFWEAYCRCNGSQIMGPDMAQVMMGRMAARLMQRHAQ
jgi:hypothetical protein